MATAKRADAFRYRSSNRGRMSDEKANLIGNVVMGLLHDGNDGPNLAEAVVENARSEDSPLHGLFPWDDREAAHEHRLMLARRYIRCFTLQRDDPGLDGVATSVPLLMRVSGERTSDGDEEGGAWVAPSEDPVKRWRRMAATVRHVSAWKDELAIYDELHFLRAAITEAERIVAEGRPAELSGPDTDG